MNALVVGSQGQDGRLLRQLLLGKGYQVTGLSRANITLPDNGLAKAISLSDRQAVLELVGQIRPKEIYYLAAHHHSSQEYPGQDLGELWSKSLEVNAAGPVYFLEAMRQVSPDTRFFYAGSCLAYGSPDESPQTEDTCLRPECPYGVSKAAGMHACRHYRQTHGLFALSGILYNHESHLRAERFLSRKIIQAAWRIKNGQQRELVLGDLKAKADWGYAPDFVQAFWGLLQADEANDCVIASGELHGVSDWVRQAFALAGIDGQEHVREDSSQLARRRPALLGDNSRIKALIGWSPATSFERMVELMFEHEGQTP